MAEIDGIDNNDSEKSEPSFLEELDLDDQIEIISPEEESVEPLKPLPEEVVSGHVRMVEALEKKNLQALVEALRGEWTDNVMAETRSRR